MALRGAMALGEDGCGENIGGWEDLDAQDLQKGDGGSGVLWERGKEPSLPSF
jgi:hypothetical protein